MYWSRTGSVIDLLIWLILCCLWWIGGWLISNHVFHLRPRESFYAGGAIGFLLFILVSNAFAYLMPLTVAYWLSGFVIIFSGLVVTWTSQRRFTIPRWGSLVGYQSVVFILTFAVFLLINRGLSIWDDHNNLPLVSTLAAGNFPPHFYLNPSLVMDYHYGLHIFAASLIKVGGFYPWSALDVAKALSTGFALALAWLWLRRFSSNLIALFSGVSLILLAAGSRWLLLFIPESFLQKISTSIQLLGSGFQTAPDLYSALPLPWNIEGAGLYPFPFAFANGIFPPLSMALAGSGAVPHLTFFLLLMLARRTWRPITGITTGLVLASLALTGTHLFLMFWGGLFIAVLVGWIIRRPTMQDGIIGWSYVLFPGLILAPVMGGVLTQVFRRGINYFTGNNVITDGVGLTEIGLRWPPAILSSHLGELAISDLSQVLVALFEMGPALLLAPFGCWLTWQYLKAGKWIEAGFGVASIMGFIAPIFVKFSLRDRDLTRLMGSALFIWLVMSLPYLWLIIRRGSKLLRIVLATCIVITIVSGLAMLPSQISAIARAQPAYFIDFPDAMMTRNYWNMLEPDARLLDLGYIFRGPTVFGRSTAEAHKDIYFRLPEFSEMMADPHPVQLANNGYSYLYLDRRSWQELSTEQKRAFQADCVILLEEQRAEMNDFRRLLDIRQCRITP